MDNIIIRPAGQEDMVEVRDLIKRHSKNSKNQVSISVEQLIRDGFPKRGDPRFQVFVAEKLPNDDPIQKSELLGYTFCNHSYSSWRGRTVWIDDLFVRSEYRGRGIGIRLVRAVAQMAHVHGGWVDLPVLSWNPAQGFYKKHGAVNMTKCEDWYLYRFDTEALHDIIARDNV